MNKSIGLIFAIFVALAVSYAFSARRGPSLPATEMRIENAMILDAERAGARLVAVGERGYIFVSDDEGGQWRLVDSGVSSALTALAFSDAQRGIAVGHDALILRTEDGGQTWQQVFSAVEQQRPLLSVAFITPEHVVAVGAYAAYFESHDGGRTWAERQVGEEDRHFNALGRLADGSLLLVGEAGALLRSRDAGANWEALTRPYAGSYFGLQPLPAGPVLVYGMRGTVLRSEDFGDSWQAVDSQGTDSLFGSVLLDQSALALLGQNGTVLLSRDQGATFRRLPHAGSAMLTAALAAPAAERLLVMGEGGAGEVALAKGEKQ